MNKLLLSAAVVLLSATACEGILDSNNEQTMISSSTQSMVNASYVTSTQARNVADAFLDRSDVAPLTRGSLIESKGASFVQTIDEAGEPLMYVVNYSDGGFVIVSATRDYMPVLAYSKEGRFDISSIEGGLGLWLDETKASVIESGAKPDSVRLKMNRLWNQYEKKTHDVLVTKATASMTPAEIACMERCEELYSRYSDEGWQFASLSGARYIFEEAGLLDYYNQLCYSANFNHSSPSCSVVGWKIGSFEESYGPMLATAWSQWYPYNNKCNDKPAGCGAIALSQVMRYHRHPQSLSFREDDGTYDVFGWNSIPIAPTSSSKHDKLVRMVGDSINIRYNSWGSWTTPGEMASGIRSLGYNVQRQYDNYLDVEREILDAHRPVIMLGHRNNTSILPGDLAYIGNSHYWVVDGANKFDHEVAMFFAEWQPYDSGQFTDSYYSIDSPYTVRGFSSLYFHHNWANRDYTDGWYAVNEGNFMYSRQNFFLSPSQSSSANN